MATKSKKAAKTKKAAKKPAKTKSKKARRPLLAKVAIKVHVPSHLSDKQALSKLKSITARWTNAVTTPGPNGTVVDIPAGFDF
ncbi:MAG TPA: hypothetical protein VNU97_10315 [Rhizomicrobium sp.]|jgi:hypothetical protein|nr:hypothetical protein [Rhizomicrobium sp.]